MTRRLRVLVVEDEMIVSMMLEDMLADLGHEVVGTAAHLDAVTATGGLLLRGVALRLLDIKRVPVGNLLLALLVAPLLVALVAALR